MELIYRTVDGKEFDNEADAAYHEFTLRDGIIMLNRDNKEVSETSRAFLVWLRDEAANLVFHEMAERIGDDAVNSITKGEDYGLFYWDDGHECYRWIDSDMADGIVKIKGMIEEKGGHI